MARPIWILSLILFAFGCVVRPTETAEEPAEQIPVRAHPHDPRYFEMDGKPLVLITSAEHYGAVLNGEFDYLRYLDTLRKDGLNYTRIFTGTYVEKEGSFGIQKNTLAPAAGRLITPWARSDRPGYVNGGNKFDLNEWDPAYFERLSDFVSKAAERGIVVEVTLFSSIYGKDNWSQSPLNSANNINLTSAVDYRLVNTLENGDLWGYQERFLRKIVRELNDHNNFFFEIQNEPWADRSETTLPINPYLLDWRENWKNRVDLADQKSLEWQRRVAEIIRDEESSLPKKHLTAQNFCNFRYPLKGVGDLISIMNFHYAYPEAVSWNYGWRRIASFDETGFSGSEPDVYRRQAWRFILSAGAVFNNLDYSFFPGAEDGTGENRAPGGGGPVLRSQLKVLRDFIQDFNFIFMGPDRSSIRLSPGATYHALAYRGNAYAVFVEADSGECELQIDLWGGPWVTEWISTRTGEVLRSEELAGGPGSVLKSPHFEGDVALKIKRKEE